MNRAVKGAEGWHQNGDISGVPHLNSAETPLSSGE
jgi:hypothetical protein